MADELVHVIDDDPAVRDSLAFLLETANLRPCVYESALAFLDALPQGTGRQRRGRKGTRQVHAGQTVRRGGRPGASPNRQ